MHTEPQPGAPTWRDRVNRLADSTDGSTHEDGIGLVQRVDRVAAFGPAILAVRWAIAIASVALATQQFEAKPYSMAVWSGMILAYTVVRTLHPLRYTGDVRSLLEVIGEVVLNVACVVATGFWDSPFILMMLTAVMVAGFARGYGFALRIGVVSTLAVSLPYLIQDPTQGPGSSSRPSGRWCCCSSPSSPATPARSPARPTASTPSPSTASGRLADANALLYSLHRVTQTLPGVARPRRRARHHRHPAPRPLRLRHRRRARLRRHRRHLGAPAPRGRQPGAPAPDLRRPHRAAAPGGPRRGRALGLQPPGRRLVRPRPPLGLGHLRRAPRPGQRDRHPRRRARRRQPLHRPRRRAAAGLRRAGRPRHRQRPLVRPPAHRRRRRGAHPHRPRPPRPHRPVPRLHGLRARQHRRQGVPGRRGRRRPSSACATTSAA